MKWEKVFLQFLQSKQPVSYNSNVEYRTVTEIRKGVQCVLSFTLVMTQFTFSARW